MKRLMMIAGPNGAGKTTTAKTFLLRQKDLYDDFLNADHIAQGLSPLHPESMNRQAGELMIQRFHNCLNLGISFAFETTASGLSYATHLKKAKGIGCKQLSPKGESFMVSEELPPACGLQRTLCHR